MLERWSNLLPNEAGGWDGRAALAAEMLMQVSSVADLGCGLMSLEKMLPSGVKYIPVDVVARDDRTIITDFNKDSLPVIAAEAAACLGLLPYLFDVPSFMRSLRLQFDTAVVSYNPVVGENALLSTRRGHAWVNDYSENEVEKVFFDTGWSITGKEHFSGEQRIWRLRPNR